MKICICNDVDEKELWTAINDALHGCYNLTNDVMDVIKEKTKATICCGKCTPEVEKMIDDMYNEYCKNNKEDSK